jgi:hypothetical protein
MNHYRLRPWMRPWMRGGFVDDTAGLVPNDDWVNGYIAKH